MQPKNNRDSNNKKIYQTHTFNANSVQLKRISFQNYHISIAKYSGPIALYLNRSIQTQNTYSTQQSDYILMFSNKGTLFNKIPFFIKQKIIFFDFLHDEVLMIGTSVGYYIVDPFRSSIKMMMLSDNFKNDKIIGYKFVNVFVYVIVGKRIFEIRNIYQPLPKEIALLNVNLENPVMIFEQGNGDDDIPHIIYLHERLEIYSSVTGNQILECKSLNNTKTKLMFFNKWIDEKSNVYYVLVFHNPLKIGFYVNGSSTFYQPPYLNTIEESSSNTKKDKQQNKQYKYNYGTSTNKGYYCAWIEDTAFLTNKKWLIRLNSQGMNVLKNEQIIINQQIDGVRVFGYNHEIIRLIPPQYLSLFKDSEHEIKSKTKIKNTSILDLYSTFELYENNNIVNIELIQQNSKHKEEIIETLIKASEFSLDSIEQIRILKFIIFLKTYYCMNINLNKLCEELRLINNLKYQIINRCLTLKQLKYLKQSRFNEFVSILLRYNLHYIADIINGGEKVYYHWAKCIIEKEDVSTALDLIIKKFTYYKEKKKKQLSFIDIARYAIETKRYQLAENLIQHEGDLKKKIMILLWMANIKKDNVFLEKALESAQKSADSDIIFRVIHQIEKKSNDDKDKKDQAQSLFLSQNITKLINKKLILKNHYIQYLKQKNLNKLKNYYFTRKQNTQLGLLTFKSYESQKYKTTQSLQIIKKLLPVINQSEKIPRSSQYPVFLKKALDKNYEINQNEIDRFKKEKYPQFLIEVLVQRNMVDKAIEVIFGIESEEGFNILFKIERWSEAIILGKERKNVKMLNKMMEVAPAEYRGKIVEALDGIRAK